MGDGRAVRTYNPSIVKTEAGESKVWPGLCSEYQPVYGVRHCPKTLQGAMDVAEW